MSLSLKPLAIENKNELISLAITQLKEEPYGFKILDREVGTKRSGYADLVALDKQNVLNLIFVFLPFKESLQLNSTLTNYYWACENILNLKKMYPNASIESGVAPKIVYLANQFSAETKKALSLLDIQIETIKYQAFEVNQIPCLYLEKSSIKENDEALWDLQAERLKKEFSGKNILSEEEILEFLSFEKGQKPE